MLFGNAQLKRLLQVFHELERFGAAGASSRLVDDFRVYQLATIAKSC